MFLKIKAERIDWKRDGAGTLRYGVIEASTAGLPPGNWPTMVLVEGREANKIFLDETLPHPDTMREANELGHHYSDGEGHFIHILND